MTYHSNNTRDLACDVLQLKPALADAGYAPVQFERQGYFVRDPDSAPGKPVFNRTVGLRDSYAKA